MAKKTNYLTELIERHERWKAEGGERLEEEEQAVAQDLYAMFKFQNPSLTFSCIYDRPASGDPEDLWDFGTVRHAGRTIGRANSSIKVSGPPLTWEMNGSGRADTSTSSSSISTKRTSSSSTKVDLPPLPSSPQSPRAPSVYEQSTVRHLPSGGPVTNNGQETHEREPLDEDNYDDQYPDTYPRGVSIVERKRDVEDDEELPDTTMLDSVILPAIASVSDFLHLSGHVHSCCPQLFPRVSTQEARVALSALQRAFAEAERIIPGVTLELVNEIVDSVERVEEDQQ